MFKYKYFVFRFKLKNKQFKTLKINEIKLY